MSKRLLRQSLAALIPSGDAFDLSWSQSGAHLESRMMCGWFAANAPRQTLAETALQWGLPRAMVLNWLQASNGRDVGFTVNRDLTSFRLYTHGWAGEVPAKNETIFTGYKALSDGRYRVDQYGFRGDLRDTENTGLAVGSELLKTAIIRIVGQAPAEVPLVFTTISNPGRQSWLATVRHGNFDAGMVTPDLGGFKLAHLAGVVDANKGSFASFYVSASPIQAMKFISDQPFSSLDAIR